MRKKTTVVSSAVQDRQAVLAAMKKQSPAQAFAVAVQAGVYDKRGQLTARYRPPTKKTG